MAASLDPLAKKAVLAQQIYRLEEEKRKCEQQIQEQARKIKEDLIDAMSQVVESYNLEMRNFLGNNPHPSFQEMINSVKENRINVYAQKELLLTEFNRQMTQLKYDLHMYEKAYELAEKRPRLFIHSDQIMDSIRLIKEDMEKFAVKIMDVEKDLQEATHYHYYKKFPKEAMLNVEMHCAKKIWDMGIRPENFEKNCAYIEANYQKLPQQKCENCWKDQATFHLPIFEFGKFISFYQIYNFRSHSAGDQGPRWDC